MVQEQRIGDWMATRSGRRFYPLDPREEDISIADIAWALSMICRYGGHAKRFYSVAEHSVHVARVCPPRLKRAALLHDAPEGYLGDKIRPLKSRLPDFCRIEERVSKVIFRKFHVAELSADDHRIIKEIDDRIIANEQAVLFPEQAPWDAKREAIQGLQIKCWPQIQAYISFIVEFSSLVRK